MLNNKIDVDVDEILSFAPCSKLRNADKKIGFEFCWTTRRKFSFRHRVAKHWNYLSPFLKNAKSTNIFKNLLDNDKYLNKIFFDFDDG